MWKLLSLKSIGHRFPLNRPMRAFSESALKANWLLNNDLIRNAISSKNQKSRKIDESKGVETSTSLTSGARGKLRSQANLEMKQDVQLKRKNMIIRWSTGSERDKAAANFVLKKIMFMNKLGTIHVINPENNKIEESNIRNFVKGVNLDELGFSIADVKQVKEGYQIPLIKLVSRRMALKRYSDEIAKKKQAELINMGVMKKTSNRTGDAEKTEDLVKQIKISWQIKLDDLNKQKAHEITSQLKRGFKVHLYLDEKNSINSKNWAASFEDARSGKSVLKQISNKESSSRQSLLGQLDQITMDYSVQPVTEGSIETRMIIKLSPKPILYNNKEKDKQTLKEQRKKERQEKLSRRIEKKKNKQEE